MELHELRLALKYLFAPNVPKKYARPQFVDVNARESEVELVTTGASVPFPAHVTRGGYGRAPYMAVDWLRRAVGRQLASKPCAMRHRAGTSSNRQPLFLQSFLDGLTGPGEAIARLKQRAGLDPREDSAAGYVDRQGILHLPFDEAHELGRKFCAARSLQRYWLTWRPQSANGSKTFDGGRGTS